MSTRKSAFGQESMKNPSEKFLTWKSQKQCFEYYDKDTQQNVDVPLPLRFVTLKQLQSVKGWNEALGGSIISNEVEYLSKQEINAVCYHKNVKGEKTKTTIAKGFYKDIKDAVTSAGARYHKSIYVMLDDNTLANLQLKGASVKQWGDFFNKSRARLADEWVTITDTIKGKKGAVTYFTPDFKLERSLSDSEAEAADDLYNDLDAYLSQYLANSIEVVDEEVIVEDSEENDDLDF